MPNNETTRPGYVPPLGGATATGAILFSATQSLTLSQQSVARANLALGSAALMTAALPNTIATSSQLVRGDDTRWATLASKADIVAGKLVLSQLPDQAVTVAVSVANQAARLALSADAARGRIFRDDDTKISYCLIAGGTPSNALHWLPVGDAVVTLNDIQGITSLGISLCGATTPALARAAMALANVVDAAGVDVAIQGNLIAGNATANKLTINVSALAGPQTINAAYRAGGPYYWVMTTQADGTLALADVTGLSAALDGKASLVGGKVPLSQLPTIVGSLTSSVSVANATARLAMTSIEAAGVIVVQADDKSSWMLKTGGIPTNPIDWLQVGDAEVRVAEIVDAGVTGQNLLLCGSEAEARAELGMSEDEAVTFASVYAKAGQFFFQISTGVWKALSKPATLSGSGWTLPNRSGYLAYSPNADGSLNGSDIQGGSPSFTNITTGSITMSGIETHSVGASERWLSGSFAVTVTTTALTANRNHGIPNGSGNYALVASSTGAIAITDVGGLSTTLAAKADLVSGKVPVSQLPVSTNTNFTNGSGAQGRVAGSLVIGAGVANNFTIDVSALLQPRVNTPPAKDGPLVSLPEVTPFAGVNVGRIITSSGSSTILNTDIGTMVEVAVGIVAITFSTTPSNYTGVTPGVLGLWTRAVSTSITGNLFDRAGTAIATLPAGHYRIALILDGAAVRFVCENYTQPSSSTQAFLKCSHANDQPFIVGVNVIHLIDPVDLAITASSQASIVGSNVFAPHVSGAWLLDLEIYARDDSSAPDPNSLTLQLWDGSSWTTSTPDVQPIYFSGSGVSPTRVSMRTVIVFDVTGAVRRARWVINGIDPPGTIHLWDSGGSQPCVKFLANRL